jgi:hypothetical protein
MKTFTWIASTLVFCWPALAQNPVAPAPPQRPRIVTAAQANGVYRVDRNEFRILALGHNKLKVQFDGQYVTMSKSINMGYAMGEAIIEGNIATFKPPDTERCEMTLVFLPQNKLKVMQDGMDVDCGVWSQRKCDGHLPQDQIRQTKVRAANLKSVRSAVAGGWSPITQSNVMRGQPPATAGGSDKTLVGLPHFP